MLRLYPIVCRLPYIIKLARQSIHDRLSLFFRELLQELYCIFKRLKRNACQLVSEVCGESICLKELFVYLRKHVGSAGLYSY